MPTKKLYYDDAYKAQNTSVVLARVGQNGIVFDQSVFYPEGGGQPGDTGELRWGGCTADVLNTEVGGNGDVILRVAEGVDRPAVGSEVIQQIDWERRYRLMRMHTALHLLTVVLPFPVTGGQMTNDKGRLDFKMPPPPGGKTEIEARLMDLVTRSLVVAEDWMSSDELDEKPDLVKTQSVRPPVECGRVRLVRIHESGNDIDLQPCGGTHVANTLEVGSIIVSKIENKGRDNRRVTLRFD